MSPSALRDVRLFVLSSGERPAHLRRALEGVDPARRGVVALQLRAPGLCARPLLDRARALAAIGRDAGAPLLVNDRADVASAVGAGLHLPERGLRPEDARALLGEHAAIGGSRHAPDEAARWRGLDYVLLAPIGAVPGKGPPLGLEALARAAAASPCPVFALGGVDPDLAARAVAAGAQGVAVLSSVERADAPERIVAALLEAMPV